MTSIRMIQSPHYRIQMIPFFMARRSCVLFVILMLLSYQQHSLLVHGALLTSEPVSRLLQLHASRINQLKQMSIGTDPSLLQGMNDVFFLRFCLENEKEEDLMEKFRNTLQWRMNAGKHVCEAATRAVQQATTSSTSSPWDNDPVLKNAPHSSIVSKYITPSNAITTSTSVGDLVYCIRAGQINDVALMKEIATSQLVDFFLYHREVNCLVANRRSMDKDRLVSIVTANDLSGISLIGGSADFRQALSLSSKTAEPHYPRLMGPTLLLNLPTLLNALVKLFTPLFPPKVNQRIKFQQGPLRDVSVLRQLVKPGSIERDTFLKQMDEIVYSKK